MKKFILAMIAITALIGLAVAWILKEVFDPALWGLWFAGLAGVLGLYGGANVVQKKIISENYRPELDRGLNR